MDTLLDRITVDLNVCHGQPCIRGTRIMVYLVLELLEAGITDFTDSISAGAQWEDDPGRRLTLHAL